MCWFVDCFFFFKQKTAYEVRISDWSSDVCSSDLRWARQSEPEPGKRVPGKKFAGVLLACRGDIGMRHDITARDPMPSHDTVHQRDQRSDLFFRERPVTPFMSRIDYFDADAGAVHRSEEHTSELQSLMRNSYAVFCLKQKKKHT